ncbi:hypothetical protein DVK00_02940 [Haloarcula sp. Atlit-47R]|uniref:hypothetical protein n=1 Tax=Haloarcula sp. Atlit-47R TaxID=2282132 RepID=UPI000EF206F3|nr:hypothetical protein [Haloarcula sp. Atlit-47R]RLM47480.1 hypothetical protein DVK00_02940 [Haloarcula sp. Atlit-47R]
MDIINETEQALDKYSIIIEELDTNPPKSILGFPEAFPVGTSTTPRNHYTVVSQPDVFPHETRTRVYTNDTVDEELVYASASNHREVIAHIIQQYDLFQRTVDLDAKLIMHDTDERAEFHLQKARKHLQKAGIEFGESREPSTGNIEWRLGGDDLDGADLVKIRAYNLDD